MFSTRFITAAAASLSLMSSVTADYNPLSQANVAMYYGQGPNQQRLAHFCDSSAVDIIPIGFINIFPNLANGLVAENFGNQCWDGNYTGPGYNGVNNPNNNFLYRQCPQLQEDIYYCQTQTKKKILLSLGGDGGNYVLNGAADGQYLADFLWGAYGPYNATWVANGGVRPLDRGSTNLDLTKTIDIDGFDFDIERASPDNQAGYIACIKRLREHFATYKAAKPCSKTYLISGAPQCPLPEGNMGLTIAGAKFDLLFIQFYNNGANGCTARNWITNKNAGGFNYNSWVTIVNQGASAGAKLYLGLLGSSSAGTSGDYLTALEAQSLIDAWHSAPQFGGVMLWEATYAEGNLPSSFPGKNYYQIMKQVLNKYAPATTAPATVCSSTVSSTRSSTSSTKTSSSTKISTTSSTIKSSSTSKSSSSSTKSSTSSKTTSTSSSKTSSSSSSVKTSSSSTKISSSSSVKPSSSSTKVSSSSSVKPSSSSTKLSSSSSVKPSSSSVVVSSSSSSSKPATTSSSSISTSKTAAGEFTTTSSSTSSAAPTATGCVYKGCFTEATGMRALSSDVLADFEGMTIEKCADFCSGYALYGLEYTGECYCGNSLNEGSVSAPEGECNLPCTGDATQTCGGSNRLNVYECGALPTSSSVSASATSSIVSISISESSSSASATSSIVSISISESSSSASATSSIVSISISESSSASATSTSESSSSTSEATVSSSSSESYITPSISMTFSYSATVTSSSSSEYVTPTISETFSYSATETSSSSSEYVTPSISNTFSYSATESSSSTSSENVTPTPSTSISSETSSSEIVTPTPSSSSETETTTSSASSETTSSTESGPVTSSTYVSSSSSFPTGPHYTNSSTTVGSTKSGYRTEVTSTSVPTYTPSSSKSSGGEVTYTSKPTSSSVTQYTTSTVCITRVETITSCAPTVTNCPVGSVTTKTIPLYTTVCPVTETEVKSTKTPIGKPTTTPVPTTYKPTGSVTKYTTSTVYATSVYTITSCAPSVTDCPSKLGHVATEIVKMYTTVCPVTEDTPAATPSTYVPAGTPVETPVETPAYTGVAVPSKSYPAGGEYDSSTTTLSSTTTQYKTIKIVKSTATIVPMPPTTLAPYPTGPASEGYPSGTAAPTAVAQVTSSAEGVTSTKTPVPIYATGAASSSRSAVGVMVAVVAGVVALML